jgi:ATP-dependent DNA helicase RecG
MKIGDLLSSITLGEDSTRQFNANVKNNDALASEMAALASVRLSNPVKVKHLFATE